VRLIPEEDVKEAAAAAASGRLHGRGSIPGLRDAAVRAASLARMVRDSGSAWCMSNAAAAHHLRKEVRADQMRLHSRTNCVGHSAGYESDEGVGDEEEECVSEEVVSNTVGLELPQASGFSGLRMAPRRHDKEMLIMTRQEEEEEEGVVVQGATSNKLMDLVTQDDNEDHQPSRKRWRQQGEGDM
jgi:hypothetical protein